MWDLIALAAVFGLIAVAVTDAAKSHSRKRAWTAAPASRTARTPFRTSENRDQDDSGESRRADGSQHDGSAPTEVQSDARRAL